jgi:GT2 family glycosyltransferase
MSSDLVDELLQDFAAETSPRRESGNRRAQAGGQAEASAAARQMLPSEDPRDCVVRLTAADGRRRQSVRQSIELVAVARDGGVMLVGWLDDADCPLDSIVISTPSWRVTLGAGSLARVRRPDVEQALQTSAPYAFGIFGLVAAASLADVPETVDLAIWLSDGGCAVSKIGCRGIGAEELRDLALGYLAAASFIGNPQVEAISALDRGIGGQIVALNRAITQRITSARYVERFGSPRRRPTGSIIVCLYGKAEFLFVQSALFAGRPGMENYEFVYVCNSPEISDTLLAEARTAHLIYGLDIAVVLLPGNAGFGAANNAGVTAALGARILNVNPDVFPRQADWAARHTALVEALPAEQTRLFGTTLYYDDGSLMHGGMYFELDPSVAVRPGRIEPRRLARVEHYGKGAPAASGTYVRPRPVPAVTGAFVSADRGWYETLGGFTEDYVFGHYEDADLCLKSFTQGTPAWLHDLRLWHLEGKGSTRRPHHEGGSLVNRWLFTRQWTGTITAGLTGPNPTHRLMTPALAEPAGPVPLAARRRIRAAAAVAAE